MSNDLDGIDYESIIHGLDPDRVFAMGEHAGAKAFRDEALALLQAREDVLEDLHFDEKASALSEAIEIIKNIAV
jgi:ribulose 1,5-bisphosphate carboxylase large subunit-like protein